MFAFLGEHSGFIVAAYGVVAIVLGGMIAMAMMDGVRQKKALADLEARGIRRRSEQA